MPGFPGGGGQNPPGAEPFQIHVRIGDVVVCFRIERGVFINGTQDIVGNLALEGFPDQLNKVSKERLVFFRHVFVIRDFQVFEPMTAEVCICDRL